MANGIAHSVGATPPRFLVCVSTFNYSGSSALAVHAIKSKKDRPLTTTGGGGGGGMVMNLASDSGEMDLI